MAMGNNFEACKNFKVVTDMDPNEQGVNYPNQKFH